MEINVFKVAYASAAVCAIGYAGYTFYTTKNLKESLTSPFVVKTAKCAATMTILGFIAPSYRHHLAGVGICISAHALFDAAIARHSPARWWMLEVGHWMDIILYYCGCCTPSVTSPSSRSAPLTCIDAH